MEVEETEGVRAEEYVICELSKFIEQKFHNLEFEILNKFEEFSNQYDADKKRLKDNLKLKFDKVTRHIDESVFTILNKGQRFETDLDKIYKKMLKLFVAPNHQHIAKTMFLKERQCRTAIDIADYRPPKCYCGKSQLRCDFEKNPAAVSPSNVQVKKRNNLDSDDKSVKVLYTWCTPQRASLLEKPKPSPGKNQSPIEIVDAIPIKMPAIEMIGYRNLLTAPITLKNISSTVVLFSGHLSEKEITLGDFVPYITGGKLAGQYEFDHIQFRWGNKNDCGSEHILNNIHYPFEMHIVHKNKKYGPLEKALKNSDGVAILAFFFQISEFDGPEIRIITEKLENLQNENDTVEMGVTFPLYSLIGNINLDQFYMYKGSLTNPPYLEVVTWVIFPDALKISASQINSFRQLLKSETIENPEGNFREVQPLGNRRIFLRKAYTNGCSTNIEEIHYTKWEWYK